MRTRAGRQGAAASTLLVWIKGGRPQGPAQGPRGAGSEATVQPSWPECVLLARLAAEGYCSQSSYLPTRKGAGRNKGREPGAWAIKLECCSQCDTRKDKTGGEKHKQ